MRYSLNSVMTSLLLVNRPEGLLSYKIQPLNFIKIALLLQLPQTVNIKGCG